MQTETRYITVQSNGDDGKKWTLHGKRNYDFLKSIPERKQGSKYGEWIVGATDTTVDLTLKHVDPVNITFSDELAQLQWLKLYAQTEVYGKIRERIAIFKEANLLPNAAKSMVHDPRAAEYQLMGAHCTQSGVDGFGLFMEQGTGKTFTAIVAMSQLPKGSKVLIVCPKQLRMNWEREIREFCTKDVYIKVIRGGQCERVAALVDVVRESKTRELSVCILHYDAIPGMWPGLSLMNWDLCCADESHYFKEPTTQRWGFMQRIRDTCKVRVPMTGTPIANSINDLWTQFEFMGQGYSGFTNFKSFKKFFGVYDRSTDNTYESFLGLQNVPIIKDRLSRLTFTVRKSEVLKNLPDKVYDVIESEMSSDQEAAYIKLQSELAFEIEATLEKSTSANQSLVVNNILTMLLKLAQITSGFLNFPEVRDPMGELLRAASTMHFDPNPKLNTLMEELKSKGPEDKTIVWATFVHDIKKIEGACKREGIKCVSFYGETSEANRIEAERLFNFDDETKVFVGNPAAGGTGLTLLGFPPKNPVFSSCNANHTIYFSGDWSTLKRMQSEDRNHRRGSRCQVRVSDLCIPNTIDEQIRARVHEKRISALEISDIRSLLQAVLQR